MNYYDLYNPSTPPTRGYRLGLWRLRRQRIYRIMIALAAILTYILLYLTLKRDDYTNDMLKAIDQVNAETIFILPNNKNIILAANQAKDLVEDKEIIVIPTKTVPQGITAIINFVPDADAKSNEETMLDEIKNVKTGQVTYAVRDTHIDDKEIHQGDIMGIGDAGILSVGQDIAETTLEMLEQLVDDDSELISLYYGQDVTEEEADAFTQEVEKLYPDIDVDVHCGGQPIYYYVLAVE